MNTAFFLMALAFILGVTVASVLLDGTREMEPETDEIEDSEA